MEFKTALKLAQNSNDPAEEKKAAGGLGLFAFSILQLASYDYFYNTKSTNQTTKGMAQGSWSYHYYFVLSLLFVYLFC